MCYFHSGLSTLPGKTDPGPNIPLDTEMKRVLIAVPENVCFYFKGPILDPGGSVLHSTE